MVFAKLQEAELPFEKLDFLLTAMNMIVENSVDPEYKNAQSFGADDFLPLLAYILCKCGFHFAEIEAEYIWGLISPTALSGQGGYYTTILSSAATSLKEFKRQLEKQDGVLVVSNQNDFDILGSGLLIA